VRLAYGASAVFFLWVVAQFYAPDTGFTSLISIGDSLNTTKTAALRGVPHYVYADSEGYDGAYYVQIALDPTLSSPEFRQTPPPIDNVQYRARRILFSWVAWAVGLGRPEGIVQAHALLNVAAWLMLAGLLLRWLPPVSWSNFLRWGGVMFSSGATMSVRNSLVDLPALLLIACAVRWIEQGRRGRGAVMLALAGLGRETSLLAVGALADGDLRRPRRWVRLTGQAALIAAPLIVWAVALRIKFGATDDRGLGNFSMPLSGLAEKWGAALAALAREPEGPIALLMVATVLALTGQFLFFALRRRPGDRWWRVGAAYAALGLVLGTPVWEGFPGAASRVLLPMTLAFNLTVPRGRRWLALLLVGNLSVLTLARTLAPALEFFQLRGENQALVALKIERTGDWFGLESGMISHWRWSGGAAGLRFRNDGAQPVRAELRATVKSAHDERRVSVWVGGSRVWEETVEAARPVELRCECDLPPGVTAVEFRTDRPGHAIGADGRRLAFSVTNLQIGVKMQASGEKLTAPVAPLKKSSPLR
jgi:hypothetical protein